MSRPNEQLGSQDALIEELENTLEEGREVILCVFEVLKISSVDENTWAVVDRIDAVLAWAKAVRK